MSKMTSDQLKQFQALPLNIKIRKTEQRIREWYEHWEGNVCVSFSGGKDSTVLLDIVRRLYPDVPAVFSDTGLEYPEIKEFVKTFPNVTIVRPKHSFKEILTKYGYPIISKEVANTVDNASRWIKENLTNNGGGGNNNLPDYSRCYAIIQTTNQVPSTDINITIMNVAPSSKYIPASTSVPSTATPCQIKQEGESSLISARTDVGSVRFNPVGTGLDTYNVGALLNRFGVQTSSNYTKTQTNFDNDIKHCVTHAENVMIDSTTTLQDWITEQYNNLT